MSFRGKMLILTKYNIYGLQYVLKDCMDELDEIVSDDLPLAILLRHFLRRNKALNKKMIYFWYYFHDLSIYQSSFEGLLQQQVINISQIISLDALHPKSLIEGVGYAFGLAFTIIFFADVNDNLD
jgi:hypothetical protein